MSFRKRLLDKLRFEKAQKLEDIYVHLLKKQIAQKEFELRRPIRLVELSKKTNANSGFDSRRRNWPAVFHLSLLFVT